MIALRAGEVLIRHTILKSDHFPGCQNTRLIPLIDGAPNFRQVSELPVFGVAIPTASGLRNVLNYLAAAKGHRKFLWINLREEPILFINGRPFVVREADKPFANLEYTGIDRENVEDMEIRLKMDVLSESENYGGSIMVAHEDDQFQVVEDWEPVSLVDVQTPAEVYAELIADGYDIDYLRVPITDEKAPKGDDFEVLIDRCWSPPDGSAIVFNCQMGRGRTTTGMVISCLLQLRRCREALAPPPAAPKEDLPTWFTSSRLQGGVAPELKGQMSMGETVSNPDTHEDVGKAVDVDEEFKNGMFPVMRSLLRALESGKNSKAALDSVLDACSAMQHLREAIASYRTRLLFETNEMRRQSLLQVCLEYLERYYVLAVFTAYLDDPAFAPKTENHIPFTSWWNARPELEGILLRMVRSNPLNALVLDQSAGGASADGMSPVGATTLRTSLDLRFEEYQEFLARREGSVLGPHTILKQDHFAGCQSPNLPVMVHGAPNFRGVAGDDIRVYGSGIPNREGVKEILEHVGAGPAAQNDDQSSNIGRIAAVWHIMREEPVVFIRGEPYVLREEFRPFKNLLEYRGIDSERLDQMENRLRDDIIHEASRNRGRVLVTREMIGEDTVVHTLQQEFLSIVSPDMVETPTQIFQKLQQEGYLVTLVRIPITDGTCPDADDFDAFYSAAAAAGPRDALIYTCQLGGGRTTTGMTIGTLLRMHLNGATLQAQTEMERQATLTRLDEDLGGKSPKGGSDDEEDYVSVEKDVVETQGHGESDGEGATSEQDLVDDSGVDILSKAMSRILDVSDGKTQSRRFPSYTELIDKEKEHLHGNDQQIETSGSMIGETRNLQDGEYVGVRRFTRTLERGAQAKAEVDQVVDACGALINLRTAIMRYRKPKKLNKFYRPELKARHIAFQRGSAYMERYCMLIAFGAYLRQCRQRGRQTTFADWLLARPDIAAARAAIHQNPASALAPVPAMLPLTPAPGKHSHRYDGSSEFAKAHFQDHFHLSVPVSEQRKVLLHRRGSTVGRRSILKSFASPSLPRGVASLSCFIVPGVTDVRCMVGPPVYTLGNATVEGLRGLLTALCASPGGPCHVVVTDLREELVLYVNGTAYLRRELEMPAAALHHAGIQSSKLEDLERRLRADMLSESTAWGGKLLLHREVEHVSRHDGDTGVCDAKGKENQEYGEDVTKSTQHQTTTTQLIGFWESTGDIGDIDMVRCCVLSTFLG